VKTVNRYVPKLVHEKLQVLKYKNKDHLYVICDMIYRISIYRKEDLDYSNQYNDIPQYYFTDIITDKKNYRLAMNKLLDEKIIICDGKSSAINGKALGYKYHDNYISPLVKFEIKKSTLIKRIINNRNARNSFVNSKYKQYKEHFLNTFKIDYDMALEYINNWYSEKLSTNTGDILKNFIKINNQYNFLLMSISAINDGAIFFRHNKTNGRIDTNLTNMKKQLKQFIISEEPLYQIDITNSQPYLLSVILNNEMDNKIDQNELIKYTQWTTRGRFYEKFINAYYKLTGKRYERDDIKDVMFCIFYSKNESYKKEKNIFDSLFPTINEWIKEQKKEKEKHNKLAIRMQQFESDICIDVICEEINKQDLKYYTIHDAWLVREKDIEKTINIINKSFTNLYDTQPTLKIEDILTGEIKYKGFCFTRQYQRNQVRGYKNHLLKK
jgi:hypothetical protein